jgi:hypothetical protein
MAPDTYSLENVESEKSRVTFRRLLLAKQLFLHGLDHSQKTGALNKTIAVHNFHNSIEITLRAIFLHHEIRPEKQLNIDFESMLNQIDNEPSFKDQGIRLPYRREMRNLNDVRNLVQHHAVEPVSSTMELWRVFTPRFLKGVCETYFHLDFDSLSPLDMIEDPQLAELLKLASTDIEKQGFKRSLTLSKIAFELSSRAILAFLPQHKIQTQLVEGLGLIEFKEVNEALEKATFFAALLSSGVNLVDYRLLLSCTPRVHFALSGKPIPQWRYQESNAEDAKWAYDFVVQTIVHWQVLGLSPGVPDRYKKGTTQYITNIGTVS